STYEVRGYATQDCANLYAFTIERSFCLLTTTGRLGFVAPIALVGVREVASIRRFILDRLPAVWFSNFAIRPAKLFDGVEQRLTIVIGDRSGRRGEARMAFSTKYHQWYKDERPTLFACLEYSSADVPTVTSAIPKVGS